MKEDIILVNRKDQKIGTGGKMGVHKSGKLHRAFSIFVFNSRGELLLQKRAKGKYHSGGLWTNTCCGHPLPGESTQEAASRRLKEEMGFVCGIREVFSFCYNARLDGNMVENEYDHVFCGVYEGNPVPDPEEVEGWKWANINQIQKKVHERPDEFTHWFKIVAKRLEEITKEAKKEPR